VESGYAGNQNMVAWITSVVRSRDVIASLHLNHSPTFDKVVECIRDGYTSVMFDGSTLRLEQNLQVTRDVVRVARLAGERRSRARQYGGIRRRDREPAPGDGASHGRESQTEEGFCLVNPALEEAHDCSGMFDELVERASEQP
jgi:Fructose-bisphosphate aldolase class-II